MTPEQAGEIIELLGAMKGFLILIAISAGFFVGKALAELFSGD